VECRIELETDNLFEYFTKQKSSDTLHTFEALQAMAVNLNRTYSSMRAHWRALLDRNSNYRYSVKQGSPWKPPVVEESSKNVISQVPNANAKKKKKAPETSATETPFAGDRTLAKSIMFMRDTMLSREMSYAVQQGDIGQAYKCVKVFGQNNTPHYQSLTDTY
jgi:hypothetical protein